MKNVRERSEQNILKILNFRNVWSLCFSLFGARPYAIYAIYSFKNSKKRSITGFIKKVFCRKFICVYYNRINIKNIFDLSLRSVGIRRQRRELRLRMTAVTCILVLVWAMNNLSSHPYASIKANYRTCLVLYRKLDQWLALWHISRRIKPVY